MPGVDTNPFDDGNHTWDIATFYLQKYSEFYNSVFGIGRIEYNNLILATHFAVGKVLLLKPRFR